MEVIPTGNTTKGTSDMFHGDVYIDIIAKGEAPSRIRVNAVHFTPGSHTAWHKHAVGQHLHVTEGVAVVQERGGDIHLLKTGDTIYTPADTWHWHGAAKNHFMTHLAIWEAPESGPESEWGEMVTDKEYSSQPKPEK